MQNIAELLAKLDKAEKDLDGLGFESVKEARNALREAIQFFTPKP